MRTRTPSQIQMFSLGKKGRTVKNRFQDFGGLEVTLKQKSVKIMYNKEGENIAKSCESVQKVEKVC